MCVLPDLEAPVAAAHFVLGAVQPAAVAAPVLAVRLGGAVESRAGGREAAFKSTWAERGSVSRVQPNN